jgi:hypothetical protein
MEMTLIFAVILVGICVLLFGVRIFFVKGGKFPNGHVEGNQALLEKGIRCAQSEQQVRSKKN